MVLVLAFAFVAVAHWHNGGHEEQQCRLCHIVHTTAIDLSHGAVLAAPVVVQRAVAATLIDPQLELVSHQIASRAPPSPAYLS